MTAPVSASTCTYSSPSALSAVSKYVHDPPHHFVVAGMILRQPEADGVGLDLDDLTHTGQLRVALVGHPDVRGTLECPLECCLAHDLLHPGQYSGHVSCLNAASVVTPSSSVFHSIRVHSAHGQL